MLKYLISALAVGLSLFHLSNTARNLPIDPYVIRSVHLSLVLVLVFLTKPLKGKKMVFLDMGLIAMTLIPGLYIFLNYDIVRLQAGLPRDFQTILSVLLVIALLEGTRRVAGLALPILAVISLAYAMFGDLIPGRWGNPGYTIDRIFGYLYLTMDGIWGMPIGVSATVLVMFVIFGAFLQGANIERVFTNLSMSIAGRTVGGPGQVAVLSSALLGTVSGSAVANVAATGSFTIPLMIKRGYAPYFAAAVEAVASTGGQIMPPIMGAGAFIMAEMLDVPYRSIVIAAIIPAILYFASAFISVHLEAKRIGLKVPKEVDLPKIKEVLIKEGYMLLPLLVMIIIIVKGYSPSYAALMGVVSVIVITLFKKENRYNLWRIKEALEKGAFGVLGVASACGCAGIALGVISMTGLGTKLTRLITQTAGGNFWATLVLAMLGAIILGMGLPTGVAYIIAAASTAPALIQLGMQPLAAHMFIFYFAILGTITPPVCLSVYTAAGIANTSWTQTAMYAIRMALPGFIIPYMFVDNSALLMDGSFFEICRVSATAFAGVFLLAAAVMGYMLERLQMWERIVLGCAALLLIYHGFITDIIGVAVGILFLLAKTKQNRKNQGTVSQDGDN